MSDHDPYSTPTSEIEVESPSSLECQYFSTTPLKLVILSVCTLGLYEIYWFYKNWVLIKKRTGRSIMPFFRAFFAPIWAYSYFKYLSESADDAGLLSGFSAGLLAVAYFSLYLASQLPDPFWLLSYFSAICLLPANWLASELNKLSTNDTEVQREFSILNWVAICIGGPFFVFMVVSVFRPEIWELI